MGRGLFLSRFFLSLLKVDLTLLVHLFICMPKLATNRTVPVLAKNVCVKNQVSVDKGILDMD